MMCLRAAILADEMGLGKTVQVGNFFLFIYGDLKISNISVSLLGCDILESAKTLGQRSWTSPYRLPSFSSRKLGERT